VEVTGPWHHEVLLEPDGGWYETAAQSRGMIYTFRDPWFFADPATGEVTLLFEANTPVPEGSGACDGEPAAKEFNGCVGVAVSPTGDPLDWELRAPLLDAVCVNQELERPHVVVRDDRYYLFVSSHMHTFAPGIEGHDALYGFVADSLRGDYRPLNGSGLVVTNPANAPFQAYSWMAFPYADEVLVQSFFNYYDFAGQSLDEIADLPDFEQRRRFGGTLGPTVRLGVDGEETRIRGTLAHWHIPSVDETLPDPEFEQVPPAMLDADGEGAPDVRARWSRTYR
jgi:levansucrase